MVNTEIDINESELYPEGSLLKALQYGTTEHHPRVARVTRPLRPVQYGGDADPLIQSKLDVEIDAKKNDTLTRKLLEIL